MKPGQPRRLTSRSIIATAIVLLLAGVLCLSPRQAGAGHPHQRSSAVAFQQAVISPSVNLFQSLAGHHAPSVADLTLAYLLFLALVWLLLSRARDALPKPAAGRILLAPSRGPPQRLLPPSRA
ncbi:MAG: hypothetical protein ABI418_08180 [Jatrophihabitantaceae bacterium]